MKKLHLIMLASFLILAAGCSQEEVLMPEAPAADVPTRVSISDALKKADKMFERIYGADTRSESRKVKSVQYHGGILTRSGEETPLYYVVNYENEGGFAVLGADTRLDAVYAISDEGHLDMNDTTFNGGLKLFFDGLNNTGIFNPDSMIYRPDPDPYWKDPQPDLPPEEPINLCHSKAPMLTYAVSRWTQEHPYNTFCPRKILGFGDNWSIIYSEERCLVGCTNVAVGQIMSYYECPKRYGDYVFNWSEMKEWLPSTAKGSPDAPEGGVARLLRELGKEGNFNTSYGLDASSSPYEKYYKRTFKTFEYHEPGDFKNFSEYDVDKLIYGGKPVLFYAYLSDRGGAHNWVADGVYYDCWKGKDPFGETIFYGEGYFFHMVWGWNGKSNGYYKLSNSKLKGNHSLSGTGDFPKDSETVTKFKYCGDFTPR